MDFILRLWLYLAFMVSGGMAIYIAIRHRELPWQKMMFGLMVVLLPFHMLEERVLPGGFHWIYYHVFGKVAVQTQLTAFFCNVPVIIILVIMFWKIGDKPWAMIFTCLFALFEFAHHTVEAVTTYQMFCADGLAIPYAPGWITSILMLGISIAGSIWVVRSKNLHIKTFFIGFIATTIFAVCFVLVPVALCNDSPYHFPDNGFYEQFKVEDIGTSENVNNR